MEKLTIEHLAPYLPYKLQVLDLDTQGDEYECYMEVEGVDISMKQIIAERVGWNLDKIKPILRPLSDLTKEIDINVEKFIPIEQIAKVFGNSINSKDKRIIGKANHALIREINNKKLSYGMMQKLFEWHFDVFGLIPQELAIDINTLCKSKSEK